MNPELMSIHRIYINLESTDNIDMKNKQLQIRISEAQQKQIKILADAANMSVSEWVLSQTLPSFQQRFEEITAAIPTDKTYAFAELNELLSDLEIDDFEQAVKQKPKATLSPFEANYLAAMVQQAAEMKNAKAPHWTNEIPVLAKPHFASELTSLRLHLLLNSPPAFKSRNIFIDSTIGDRV